MFTRQDYLAGKVSHRNYYGQFVNEEVKNKVLQVFDKDILTCSYKNDEYFNDSLTPMKQWDKMGGFVYRIIRGEQIAVIHPTSIQDIKPVNYTLLKQTGEGASNSTMVCIYKEAARQIVEQNTLDK